MQVMCIAVEPEPDGRFWHMDGLAELLLETTKGVTPLYDMLVRCRLNIFCVNEGGRVCV